MDCSARARTFLYLEKSMKNKNINALLVYIAIIVILFLMPVLLQGATYYIHVLILCALNVMLAISLRTITVSGQMSLGHVGFMGIGAYTSASLVSHLGLPVYLSVIIGAVAAAIVALVIAYPVTRVKTIYLAMLTLFFGEIIRLVFTEWRGMTGGESGMSGIKAFENINFFGLFTVNFASRITNYYFILILTLLVVLFFYLLDRSYYGKTIKAIAQDEQLASSSGIDVTGIKITVFCICCFIAGLSGSLYAHYVQVLTPNLFGITPSLYAVIYVVVGGTKRFAGAIVGAVLLTLVPELASGLQEYKPFIYVAVLYLVVFLLPGGLVDLPARIRLWFKPSNRSELKNAQNN
jgi:branched-chain amino acid transport system permease protein